MLEAFGPKLYHTFTDKKAAMVERVQRTLRGRLGRLFTKRKNFKWIDKIEDIVTAYNHSNHRSIGIKPVDVDVKPRRGLLPYFTSKGTNS